MHSIAVPEPAPSVTAINLPGKRGIAGMSRVRCRTLPGAYGRRDSLRQLRGAVVLLELARGKVRVRGGRGGVARVGGGYHSAPLFEVPCPVVYRQGSYTTYTLLFRSVSRLATVAPQPPDPEGASLKDATKGVRASTARTISRCTPMPRPWMIRISSKPA